MKTLEKIAKLLLYPHAAILLVLLPTAVALSVYAMLFCDSQSPTAVASYTISAYTLTIWCLRIPQIISLVKKLKNENRYVLRWRNDVRLRMNITLFASSLWNAAYAVFQLCLGFYHRSFWFCSLAAYYTFLAVMRFVLGHHTRKHDAGEKMRAELVKYRACGWIFLVMNLALSLMVFFMVYHNRTFNHHEITTIAMAAYTFTTFTVAIINAVKYRKYNSPVYSASKSISLTSACVSMLTLTSTMLTTFGSDGDMAFRRLTLALTGVAVSIFVITMALSMIVGSTRKLRNEEQNKWKSSKKR